MTGALISNFLICSKASLSLEPYFLDLPVHVRSHKGLDIVENPGREFGTELGISREASYFRLILWFHSPLGDLQPLSRAHFSHVLQALGSNDTLFTVMGHPMLFKLACYFVKVSSCSIWSRPAKLSVSAEAILKYLPFSG